MAFQSIRACELAEENRDRFANALYYIGRIVPPNYQMGTANEMRSSGKIGLIESAEIRDQINRIESSNERDKNLLPVVSNRAVISMAYMDQYTIINKSNLEYFETITWNDLETDFSSLCSDQKVLGSLSFIRSVRHIYNARLNTAIEHFLKLKDLLELELQKET